MMNDTMADKNCIKNCLILGAGLMQKPAILASKSLGLTTVVIDADDKAVCIPLADKFYKIDLKAKDEIVELAEQLEKNGGLKAVFTAGTDFSASVSYVCEKLNLPAHSYEAALNASIKTRMRQCFADKGVPSPKFTQITKNDLADKASAEAFLQKLKNMMDFPLVVKPVDNMGARGCRMVRCEAEFLTSAECAVEASRSGNAIVEEYMDGPEFSIDALVYDGSMTITGFAERHIYYPPYFIEVGHTMPAILEKKVHDELISAFADAAKSLGLTCGAAKADIKYTKKGPMIGEIAGRLSGGYMSGWTYPYASDLNLTKQGLLIACGEKPEELVNRRILVDYVNYTESTTGNNQVCNQNHTKPYELFEIPCVRTSAERAWISIPGTVEYIENIQDYTDKAICDVLPRATVQLGSEVDFPRNNVQKCGNIISTSNNREIAIAAAENAVSDIFITLKPNDARTEKFLSGVSADDEDKFPPSAFGEMDTGEAAVVEGVIPVNTSAAACIPQVLKTEKWTNKTDWNYNTILQTAQKFDVLRKNHPELDAKTFWKYVLRGGIQAAVYYSDSVGEGV